MAISPAASPPRRLAASPPRRLGLLGALSLSLASSASAQTTVLRVDAALTGQTGPSTDGSTWPLAFGSPTEAIVYANNQGFLPQNVDLWLAEGVYPATTPAGNPTQSINVPSGMDIIGGFVGNETTEDGRAGSARLTVLSGDFNLDGDPSNNSYQVVRVFPGQFETRLYSLTVTDGNGLPAPTANGRQGGGISAVGVDLRMRDCLVSNNQSEFGGGLYFNGAPSAVDTDAKGLRMDRCFFLNNFADRRGGAIDAPGFGIPTDPSSGSGDPECSWMYNCQFVRNRAGGPTPLPDLVFAEGGAIYFGEDRYELQPDLQIAGAMGASISDVTMTLANCRFTNNAVHGNGSAILIEPSSVPYDEMNSEEPGRIFITSTTIAGNIVISSRTLADAGAIYVGGFELGSTEPERSRRATFVWHSIVTNADPARGTPATSDAIVGPGSYGAGDQDWAPLPTSPPAGYSSVDCGGLVCFESNVHVVPLAGQYGGSVPGSVPFNAPNQNLDPLFIDFANRNLRLQGSSPSVDVGNTALSGGDYIQDFPDLDGDSSVTDDLSVTLEPLPRVVGPRMDYGCYERTVEGN